MQSKLKILNVKCILLILLSIFTVIPLLFVCISYNCSEAGTFYIYLPLMGTIAAFFGRAIFLAFALATVIIFAVTLYILLNEFKWYHIIFLIWVYYLAMLYSMPFLVDLFV